MLRVCGQVRPSRDQRGAAAIVSVLIAAVLMTFAALAVDLGNGLARKGDTQVQADFAALAGGAELPGTKSAGDPAVKAAADYLTKNAPQDDRSSKWTTDPTIMANNLVDGDAANGEVYFQTPLKMNVISPRAQVDFGFAGIFSMFGASMPNHVDVASDATVELRSPGNMLPFFLPRNCLTGPVALKDNTHGSPGNANLTFDPASGNGTVPDIDAVDPALVPFGSSGLTITLEGSKFNGGTLEADFFQESSNDRIPVDTANAVPATYIAPGPKQKDKATVVVPDGVANRPGYWQVRLKNSSGWSKKFGRIFVDIPSVEPGCGVAATGDFGFLDSPRAGVNQQAVAMALNIAKGVDHNLTPFTAAMPPDVADSCNGNGSTPYPGAVLDLTSPPPNDPNCVSVQTGFNSGDSLTKGLITGDTSPSYDGLLKGDTLEGCDRFGGSSEKSRLGVSTNDDVLSCFLPTGVRVGDVTGKTISNAHKNVISSEIFDSPRFAVVPVINYPSNPQNGFYPILKFWPVFITDESPSSTHGNSFASSLNGVVLSPSDNKVASLVVVPIHPDAMPETTDDNGEGTIPWIGSGTRVVVMID